MAFRLDYVAKETGRNLVRNPSLTIATVLTVAVSLTLLGAAMLIRVGVAGLNDRFRDDVEFIVWVDPDVTPEHLALIVDTLDSSANISDSRYVAREEVYAEFQQYYRESPTVLELVNPDEVPTYFEVVPIEPDLAVVQALGKEYEKLPGVFKVQYAAEYIKKLNDFTRLASRVMMIAALFSAGASTMLMYNTIRTAMYARRREIEVMRLVGATNWFIRLPFMIEGMIQGAIGAGFSVIAVLLLNRGIGKQLNKNELKLLASFDLNQSDLLSISGWLLLAGAMIGFLSAGIAVTRYLDA
jgi:cell division transport system permease protein